MKFAKVKQIVLQRPPFSNWGIQPIFENVDEMDEYCIKYFPGQRLQKIALFQDCKYEALGRVMQGKIIPVSVDDDIDEYEFLECKITVNKDGEPHRSRSWIVSLLSKLIKLKIF